MAEEEKPSPRVEDVVPPEGYEGFVPLVGADGKITGWAAPTQGYGGGGGYGISTPSKNDQKAAKLLSSIVNENVEIIKDSFTAQTRVYDISDEMSKNLADKRICQARRKAGQEWYTTQQKLQAASTQLADVAGGALRSSLFPDFVEMVSRADDQADTELLKTMRENIQEIEISYAEAKMQTINSRNDLAAKSEEQLRQMFTDWLAQLVNIHPDLAATERSSPTGDIIIDLTADVPAQATTPDWLNYEQWYEEHINGAIQPSDVAKSRPDKAAQMAWLNGCIKEQLETEGSPNALYWEALQNQSERKTQ